MTDRDYADLMADGASTTVINSLKSVMGDEGKVNILLLGKLVQALGSTLHFWDVGRCGAEGGGTTPRKKCPNQPRNQGRGDPPHSVFRAQYVRTPVLRHEWERHSPQGSFTLLMLRLCCWGWAQVLTLARRQVQQVEEAKARGKEMLMGSILVFLPGLRQIRDSHDLLMTGRGHFRGSDMTLEEARPRPHPRTRLQYRTFRTVLSRACPLELLQVPYPGFVLVSVSAVRTAPWLKRALCCLCVAFVQAAEAQEILYPLMLHSTVSRRDQDKVFQRPPEGLVKVVLSTNMAETSATRLHCIASHDQYPGVHEPANVRSS